MELLNLDGVVEKACLKSLAIKGGMHGRKSN